MVEGSQLNGPPHVALHARLPGVPFLGERVSYIQGSTVLYRTVCVFPLQGRN